MVPIVELSFQKTVYQVQIMIIVIVTDLYNSTNNGTTVSARRLVEALEERGHEVRLICSGTEGKNRYILPTYQHGLIPKVASWNGMVFCKPIDSIIAKALEGADIVHCYMPFPLEKRVMQMAKERGIPCTTAMHVQAQHVTYNAGMSGCNLLSSWIYVWIRQYYYQYFDYIHCPSQFMADELERYHYKAKTYVISNGICPIFKPKEVSKIPSLKGKFCILMVGRLSKEKRQDVLIKACSLSKYASNIQLILAGHGPKEEKYHKLSQSLPNPVIFGFYSQSDLVNLYNMCDLYVHAADVESEAISCMEAFACGLVPVIANSPISATKQFALDERSLFKHGDAQDLADHIDYWIEHPEEKKELSKKYIESSAKYDFDHCVDMMIGMFNDAIADKANV